MNASSLTPPSRPSQEPAPCGPSRRPSRTSRLVGWALVVLTAGCSDDPAQVTTPSASSTATTTSSPAASPARDNEALILEQYGKFWAELSTTSRLDPSERRETLARVAVDPQLSSVLKGFEDLDAKGHVLYGTNKPRPTVKIDADQQRAVVDDCQDSSAAGTAEKATGKRLTVGRPRNHVVVTMRLDADGAWKMAFASYTKKPC